jgi:hypothetical protein
VSREKRQRRRAAPPGGIVLVREGRVITIYRFSIALIAGSLASLALTRLRLLDGYVVFLIGIAASYALTRRLRPQCTIPSSQAVAMSSGLALLIGGYVFAFATTELWAGRDNGVYTLVAESIARHRAVDVDTPVRRQAEELLGAGLIADYPGIYADTKYRRSNNPDGYHAQFNHASPAVRAAFVQVFGRRGMALSSAAFAAAAVFAFSILAVSLVGTAWGLAATTFLVTNASFVYVARSSLSEIFTLIFVAIAFLFCRVSARESDNTVSALIAGTAIGCVMLARVDGYLIAPLALVTIFVSLARGTTVRGAAVLCSCGLCLFIWSIFDLYRFSTGYFMDLVERQRFDMLIAATAGVWSVAAALILFCAMAPTTFRRLSEFATRISLPVAKVLAVIAALIFLIVFLRSVLAGHFNINNAAFYVRAPVEMTWYITIPVLILAFWGAYSIVRRDQLLGMVIALPSLLLVIFFAAYTNISPDHPWASRRWVPFAFPTAILLAAVAFADLARRRRALAAPLGALLIAVYAYHQDRIAHHWFFRPLQTGWVEGFDKLAAALASRHEPFFLASSAGIASLLTHVYGIPTAPLNNVMVGRSVEGLPAICGASLGLIFGSRTHPALVGTPNPIIENCLPGAIYLPPAPDDPNQISARLVSGWSAIESWGVWSDSPTAELELVRPRAFLDELVKLTLEGRAFLAPSAPTQQVTIYLESEFLTRVSFDLSSVHQTIVLEAPAHLVRGKKAIKVRFQIANPRSPDSVGMGRDNRRLGFGLSNVRIR